MPTLQGLFVQPRKGLDPRVPQTDVSKRSIGQDGKLYKLVPKKDMPKYRVMDDFELSLEQRRTQDLATSLIERMSKDQKRLRSLSASSKPKQTFGPPQFSALKKKHGDSSTFKVSSSINKENSPNEKDQSVQLLRSSQQQSEKIIELLYKEKKDMEREISALKLKLAPKQLATYSSVDDIGVRTEDDRRRSTEPRRSSRPQSATRASGERTFDLSLDLQADIDRYVRRRHEVEEHEHRARMEQSKYAEELRQRSLRASLKGREFEGLMQRQKEAEQLKSARFAKKAAETEESTARERRELSMQRQAHLNKSLPSSTLSWKDIEAQEQEKRKQRVEARKQELLMMTSPFKAAEAVPKKKKETAEDSDKFVFKAKDPQEVVARLSQQQEVWKSRLDAVRQKTRSSEKLTKPVVTSLELRAEEYAAKKKERQQRLVDKEKEKNLQKQREEEKRMHRLLSAKIPDASKRLTKSVELKIGQVRASKDGSIAEEKRKEEQAKKRRESMKQASAVVRTIVEEREAERKQQHGGFTELRASDQLAAEKAAASRAEFREKLRANRRRIQEALKSRPSLIERHEADLRKRTASTGALRKVAEAIRGSVSASSTDYDELFDDEEKMKMDYE